MTDEELEHRLTAVENRAQSNTHRLDELGKLTDAVNGMNTNIKLTIQQLENTNKSLEIVTAQNKKQEDRLTALEKAPGAEKKAHVIAVLRGYTPDWLDWAINERTLDWIVQLVFDFTKKKLEDYMAKKSVETTTVARFGKAGEDKHND